MFNVLEIKCKKDGYTGNSDIDRENTWDGQIVVDESGYFEGLVIPPYREVHEERFVFDVYKGNNISLYKY